MSNTKNRNKVLDSRRLQSIELQVYTFLNGTKMTIKRVESSFEGLASLKAI
jgi:hypothetical protein